MMREWDGAAPARTGLVLFQPDIGANVAASQRLAACLGALLIVIEPCGFVWDERRMRRVGMDYLAQGTILRSPSFSRFEDARRKAGQRLVLLTTRAALPYHEACYRSGDLLMAGRESAGVPDEVRACADFEVRVPMAPLCRSLNLVTALAVVLGEVLRQTDGFSESSG